MAIRERSVRVRMNEEDLRMLSAVAKREGLTASAWLRRKILETYRRHFGTGAPAVQKP